MLVAWVSSYYVIHSQNVLARKRNNVQGSFHMTFKNTTFVVMIMWIVLRAGMSWQVSPGSGQWCCILWHLHPRSLEARWGGSLCDEKGQVLHGSSVNSSRDRVHNETSCWSDEIQKALSHLHFYIFVLLCWKLLRFLPFLQDKMIHRTLRHHRFKCEPEKWPTMTEVFHGFSIVTLSKWQESTSN